jgi:hypothetical protein
MDARSDSVPAGPTARLEEVDGSLLADSGTVLTDEDVLALLDAVRRQDLIWG